MPRIDVNLTRRQHANLRQFAATTGDSLSDIGRRAIARVVSEPSPYPMTGSSDGAPCLVRDLATVYGFLTNDFDRHEAEGRVRRFEEWSADAVERFALTTGTHGEVTPPSRDLRPDLVPAADRPLYDAANQGTITDGTPLTIPEVQFSGDVVDAARVEGAQPTPGSVTFASRVATPASVQGVVELTREIVDSAVPAGDAILLAAAAEDWRRKVEARIYTELKAAQGGTPYTVTTTPATFAADLRTSLASFAGLRLRPPRNVVVGGNFLEPAGEIDWTLDTPADFLRVNLRATATPFTTAIGDPQAIVLGTDDLWSWESPLLRFTYRERKGPAGIDIAVSGYHASRVIRPGGYLALAE